MYGTGGKIASFLAVLVALVGVLNVSRAAAHPQAITYTVNSDADHSDKDLSDSICSTSLGECTLRAAIENANQDGIESVINFAKPMDIYPVKYLDPLTEDGTTIDGSNQWDGSWPSGNPGVRIIYDNASAGILTMGAENCFVRGIEFSGSNSVGIYLVPWWSRNNTIGGSGMGQRNVFVGMDTGIYLNEAQYNTIVGNYIGTRDGLTPIGNQEGIYLDATNSNIIEENLISGNSNTGVYFLYGSADIIRDNIIGANRDLNGALPNGIGVHLGGWATLGPNNFIVGNASHGVYSSGYGSVIK